MVMILIGYYRLRCLGPQTHLKNKFGRGYRLSLLTDDNAQQEEVER